MMQSSPLGLLQQYQIFAAFLVYNANEPYAQIELCLYISRKVKNRKNMLK